MTVDLLTAVSIQPAEALIGRPPTPGAADPADIATRSPEPTPPADIAAFRTVLMRLFRPGEPRSSTPH